MPTRRRGRTASRSDCVSESLRGRGRSAPPSHLNCAAMNRALLLLLLFFAAPLLAQTTPLAQLPYTPSLAAEHPRTYGAGWLFGFGSTQDYGDATQVIAEADAGGLGMPDRDYYVNGSARSKELRAKYLAHVRTMLELSRESKARAKADAATVMRIETALAKAS